MAQIARTDDKKPAEDVRSTAGTDAYSTAALGGKIRDKAHDVAEMAANMVGKSTANAVGAVEQLARNVPRLALSTPESAKDFAGFWQDLVKAQIEHNLDAFRKLATARDWQEHLNVQSSYILGNLARMSEAASRCMQLTGSMAARMPTTDAPVISKPR